MYGGGRVQGEEWVCAYIYTHKQGGRQTNADKKNQTINKKELRRTHGLTARRTRWWDACQYVIVAMAAERARPKEHHQFDTMKVEPIE